MASIVTPEPKSSPEDLSVWTAEGQGITIEYLHSALEDVRLEAVKGITLLRHGGVEVGGVLFGTREEDRIRIFDSRALRSEYAFGPNLVLSQNDEEALNRLLEEAKADPKLSGMEPVGWYHSHTRTGIFLSESDIAIYNRYFPEPWQVALIVHPAQLGPTEAGFFFREADGSLRSDSSYHSFTIYPTYPPAKVLEGDHETEGLNPPLDAGPGTPFDFSSRELPLPPPRRHTTAKPSKLSWPWLLAALILGVLGVGVLAGVFHISGWPAGRPTLNLRATDHGGQVHVEWDRSADPIQAAQKASLLIQDGDRKLETPLSGELLQHGSLAYRRKTGDVEIRLRVYGDDAEPVQESMRLIGLPVIPEERLEAADRPARSTRGAKHLPVSDSSPGEPTIQWIDRGKRESPVVAEKPELVSRNIVSAPRAPDETVYRGPMRGRLIWTGRVPPGGRLEITGAHASTGKVTGRLPDAPIKISAYPASFSRHGIVAYAADLPNGKEFREPPARTNGWTEMVYKRNAKRAGAITVTQIPAARNHWRSIGLRADRGVSAMVIDWEVLRGYAK